MSWLSEGATSVLWNIVGGAITVGLFAAYERGRNILTGRAYRAVFGDDVRGDDFHLIYGLLSLKSLEPHDSHPYRKTGLPGVGFSIENPISSCELRAAKYLSESIAKNRFSTPRMVADLDLYSKINLSYVAFGGPLSNSKTRDALACDSSLVVIDGQQFRVKSTSAVALAIEPGFDYGLIQKTHPPQFPDRTWLVCAGLGEWGSSGSAWYLANKWKDIHAFAQEADFAIIVKVRPGQDEYAEVVFRLC